MPAQARAPIGASLLSRFDLSDEENVRQAEFELHRCTTDFDFARWARNWGEAAIARLNNGPDREVIEDSEEYRSVDAGLTTLENAAKAAVKALEPISEREDIPDVLSNELGEIIGDLETALQEASQ